MLVKWSATTVRMESQKARWPWVRCVCERASVCVVRLWFEARGGGSEKQQTVAGVLELRAVAKGKALLHLSREDNVQDDLEEEPRDVDEHGGLREERALELLERGQRVGVRDVAAIGIAQEENTTDPPHRLCPSSVPQRTAAALTPPRTRTWDAHELKVGRFRILKRRHGCLPGLCNCGREERARGLPLCARVCTSASGRGVLLWTVSFLNLPAVLEVVG